MQVGLFKIRKVPSLLFDSFFPVDCGIGCAIGSWFSALPVTSSLELLQVEEEQDADSAHFVVASRTDFDPALTCPDLKCDDGRIYEFSSAVLQTEMFHEETTTGTERLKQQIAAAEEHQRTTWWTQRSGFRGHKLSDSNSLSNYRHTEIFILPQKLAVA